MDNVFWRLHNGFLIYDFHDISVKLLFIIYVFIDDKGGQNISKDMIWISLQKIKNKINNICIHLKGIIYFSKGINYYI